MWTVELKALKGRSVGPCVRMGRGYWSCNYFMKTFNVCCNLGQARTPFDVTTPCQRHAVSSF